jgi:hypothetical protein
MKEYKSIEAPDNLKMQIHHKSKVWNRVRTSNSKVSCKMRNRSGEWFQPMKEHKSIEVMDNAKMRIGRKSKVSNLIRTSHSKSPNSERNKGEKLCQLMKGHKRSETKSQGASKKAEN